MTIENFASRVMNLTICFKLPGHPHFTAHAYPPDKQYWWEGNQSRHFLQTSTIPLFGRESELLTLEASATLAEQQCMANNGHREPYCPLEHRTLTAVKGIAGIGLVLTPFSQLDIAYG
jgi:hypothetical protein